jgi:signal peptidase I
LLFAALVFARIFVMQNYSIASASMLPTFRIGDFVLATKVAYRDKEPARGDIVIVKAPDQDGPWIKRIIGLPGDRIQLVDGVVWLNGKPVKRARVSASSDVEGTVYREFLPNGRTFLTLDIADTEQDDTAIHRLSPGKYFVLGDNRDNSDDSRMSLGDVDRSDILGQVVRRYFSATRGPEFSPVE